MDISNSKNNSMIAIAMPDIHTLHTLEELHIAYAQDCYRRTRPKTHPRMY